MSRSGAVRVSVVIPVYNSGPYLAECLDSVLAQDMPPDDFEVVAVDDGSTDGSGEALDDYAARHANVRVIHQENSGWPGRPRNVGLDAAEGTYVFFADSDDRLGPEALRRMVDFAQAHDSDVLVAKLVHDDGTPFGGKVWRGNQVDADLRDVIVTLGPWKLFRKDFLDRQGLRFPEGRVRLEDGIFVTQAYCTARRVSVLADYAFYFKRDQSGGGNISKSPADAGEYTSSIQRMIAIVRQHCGDAAVADRLVSTLYRRKALKWFGPGRFARYSASYRAAWVAAVADLAEQHVPPRLDGHLPLVHRIRSVLVRGRETEALRAFSEAQDAGHVLETVATPSGLELRIPGLSQPTPLRVLPDLRLVADSIAPPPAAAPARRATAEPWRVVADVARRRLWPVARRSAVGRRAWAWARDRLGPARG